MSHDKSTRSAWPAGLALVCFALVQLSAARQSDEPWYCHSLDCPSFTTLKWSDGLELRSYQDSLWVSTNISGVSYDTAVRYGFLRLFEYISGANEHGWRIEMTAPVRTRLISGEGPFCEDTFTVSFYLPDEYQSGGKKPPAPNRDSLFIDSTPGIKYWVYSYPGFTSQDKIISTVSEVIDKLEKLGEKFSATTYYAAGYDPPFRIINRHNEVWVPVEPENSASLVSKVQGKGTQTTNRKIEIKGAAA